MLRVTHNPGLRYFKNSLYKGLTCGNGGGGGEKNGLSNLETECNKFSRCLMRRDTRSLPPTLELKVSVYFFKNTEK